MCHNRFGLSSSSSSSFSSALYLLPTSACPSPDKLPESPAQPRVSRQSTETDQPLLTALDTSARRGRPGGTANRICTEYPQEEESGRLLGARRPLRKDAPRAQGSAEGSIDRGGPRQSASTERAMAMMGEEGKRCSGRAGRNEARRNSLWVWELPGAWYCTASALPPPNTPGHYQASLRGKTRNRGQHSATEAGWSTRFGHG